MTGLRDLKFSKWIRRNLPASETGFCVTDLDFILYNSKTRSIMLIEVKTKGREYEQWQKNIFIIVDAMFCRNAKNQNINYLGFHTVVFTGEQCDWECGECYLDKKRATEAELRELLSF